MRSTARVEAGVLVAGAEPRRPRRHGLSSLPGSSPDVGVIGYTLGGGLSWLGRQLRLRLQPRHARSSWSPPPARRARVDAENDPDLFWALRGGGGGYAIVTALHLDLVPIADIYAGALLFPAAARRRCLPRLPRLGRDASRGRHLGRPLPPAADRPRRPGAAARHAADDDRRRLHRQPRARARPRSRRCARSASR